MAAYHRVKRQGLLAGEEFGEWLLAEAEVERRHEPRRGDDSNANAKQDFQQNLQVQLVQWDARLDELKAKARDAKPEIRAEFEVQLEALAVDRALAQEKLQELRRHGE